MSIKDIITAFEATAKKRQYKVGQEYYETKNGKIMHRKFMSAYTVGDENKFRTVAKPNPYKANNKIASSFYKLLIDQKINYLLGAEPTYATEDERASDYYGKDFYKNLKMCSKKSSIKGLCWLFVYVEDGVLKTQVIEPDNVIPMYDKDNNLAAVYRYWIEGKEQDEIITVEKWDNTNVTLYEIKGGKEKEISSKPHMTKEVIFENAEPMVMELNSWGRIPFIPLKNTDEEVYDLNPIKSIIDAYDVIFSDFANNLEDFQDVYWILKNYNGTNAERFLADMQQAKVLKLGLDGDAKAETIEIPHEARRIFLEGARRDIMDFGMGLDTRELAGGSLTNVVIRARYANLDLKASDFQSQVENLIDEYAYFVNRFISVNKKGEALMVEVKFNKTQIINEVELLDANVKQTGNISKETQLENHSWVQDVSAEMERLEQESGFDSGEVTADDNE